VHIQIRIQLSFSKRIWIQIQGVEPLRIHADTDPDPGQTLKSQKVENFYIKNIIKLGNRLKAYIRSYKSLFEGQENQVSG
jgi:hypothetical protein